MKKKPAVTCALREVAMQHIIYGENLVLKTTFYDLQAPYQQQHVNPQISRLHAAKIQVEVGSSRRIVNGLLARHAYKLAQGLPTRAAIMSAHADGFLQYTAQRSFPGPCHSAKSTNRPPAPAPRENRECMTNKAEDATPVSRKKCALVTHHPQPAGRSISLCQPLASFLRRNAREHRDSKSRTCFAASIFHAATCRAHCLWTHSRTEACAKPRPRSARTACGGDSTLGLVSSTPHIASAYSQRGFAA